MGARKLTAGHPVAADFQDNWLISFHLVEIKIRLVAVD
jgi:hypothetical protein